MAGAAAQGTGSPGSIQSLHADTPQNQPEINTGQGLNGRTISSLSEPVEPQIPSAETLAGDEADFPDTPLMSRKITVADSSETASIRAPESEETTGTSRDFKTKHWKPVGEADIARVQHSDLQALLREGDGLHQELAQASAEQKALENKAGSDGHKLTEMLAGRKRIPARGRIKLASGEVLKLKSFDGSAQRLAERLGSVGQQLLAADQKCRGIEQQLQGVKQSLTSDSVRESFHVKMVGQMRESDQEWQSAVDEVQEEMTLSDQSYKDSLAELAQKADDLSQKMNELTIRRQRIVNHEIPGFRSQLNSFRKMKRPDLMVTMPNAEGQEVKLKGKEIVDHYQSKVQGLKQEKEGIPEQLALLARELKQTRAKLSKLSKGNPETSGLLKRMKRLNAGHLKSRQDIEHTIRTETQEALRVTEPRSARVQS